MTATVEELRTVLKGSRLKAVKNLLADLPKQFLEGDLKRIEKEIIGQAPENANLSDLLNLVYDIAIGAGTPAKFLRQIRVPVEYPLPKNPVAGGFQEDEQICSAAASWLEGVRAKGQPIGKTASMKAGPELKFLLFLVSAILEYRVLHRDYVPAVIRSLDEERDFTIHTTTISGILLSLDFGRQQNAELRLLILRQESVKRLRDFLHTTGARGFLKNYSGHREAGALLKSIERSALRDPLIKGDKPPSIDRLIRAAQTIAIMELPSTVVAHRAREIVSHSLSPKVLNRFGSYKLSSFRATRNNSRQIARKPEDPETHAPYRAPAESPAMGSLRIALDENGLDVPRLRRLASDDAEPNVSVLAEFALYLSRPIQSPQRRKSGGGCDPATVGRYCLLIATKLIPRLQDPVAKVTDDAWEDALEELLDEDSFYQLRRYSERPSSSSQTNSRPLVKALRHWLRFLSLQQFTSIPNKSQENPTEFGDDQRTAGAASKETTNAADRLRLAKLEKRLPVLGLVNVDAALITVDEYLKALRRLGEWKGINNLHDREAARIALILGYRCGLRRSETAWLRICDFDRIDYLHIRPTEMRPLKTSNANRDLPLSLLVPEEELIQIRKRVSQVRSQARQKKIPPDQAYLFSESREPGKRMNFNTRLVRKIYKAFKGDRSRKWDPIDSDFRYHRLRHSCATILLLKLWPELHKIARHVLKQDATKTIDWIEGRGSGSFRNKLFGNMHVTEADLQAIALLMGHGSAATSLEHYLHVLDWYEMPNSWD